MSFERDIRPYRYDRVKFCQSLLNKLDTEWRRVIAVDFDTGPPGGYSRSGDTPTHMDKQRIKALLKAWKHDISERYLEFEKVTGFSYRDWTGFDEANQAIRQNMSRGGAVGFLRHEIEAFRVGGNDSFFGDRLWSPCAYDAYFSQLLKWDDRHCYGLVLETALRIGADAGACQQAWQAAHAWIIANRANGVYSYYDVELVSIPP